jgi:hypothetical protein
MEKVSTFQRRNSHDQFVERNKSQDPLHKETEGTEEGGSEGGDRDRFWERMAINRGIKRGEVRGLNQALVGLL